MEYKIYQAPFYVNPHDSFLNDFKIVYTGHIQNMPDQKALDELFFKFNDEPPKDYKGRAISIGDIISLDGCLYMKDPVGFHHLLNMKIPL